MFSSPFSRRSLALLLAAASIVSATPYPKDDLHDAGMGYLMPRNCGSYCGSDNQICCESNESCVTLDGDIATCTAGGGSHPYQTTTWTETRTFTSTLMTWWEPAPEPTEGVDCIPKNDQQEACGAICCAGWQTCAFDGQCSARPGYDEPSTIVITTGGVTTTQYSAPYRITGTTTVVSTDVISTVTEGASATTDTAGATGTNEPIGAGGGGGGGLSGGEIAGIVIGSIAGAMLLLLIAFCCIARGLWKACFGRKKTERTEVYEERYSRHGSRPPSTHSRRDHHTGWFGGGGGGSGEKKSSGKKWLGIAGLAATLLALLNLKKDKKPARKTGGRGSRHSGSYYSYSDYTSPSSSSSGRRTHRTGSRAPPSQYTKTSRRS